MRYRGVLPGAYRLADQLLGRLLDLAGRDAHVLFVSTHGYLDVPDARDHGPGLPAQFDGRWFEPYMSTKPKGGGLGLAMVQKIAEEHGGSVRAENAEGGGARFVLTLPIVRTSK